MIFAPRESRSGGAPGSIRLSRLVLGFAGHGCSRGAFHPSSPPPLDASGRTSLQAHLFLRLTEPCYLFRAGSIARAICLTTQSRARHSTKPYDQLGWLACIVSMHLRMRRFQEGDKSGATTVGMISGQSLRRRRDLSALPLLLPRPATLRSFEDGGAVS